MATLRVLPKAALRGSQTRRRSRLVPQLKRSNVRAIVLWNALHRLAQAAFLFPVDHAACSTWGAGGRSLQAPLVPGTPVFFCLCALRDCRVYSVVHFVCRPKRGWRAL